MNRKQSSTGVALHELGELFLSWCWQFCYSAEKDKLWRLSNTGFSIHPRITAVFTYSRHAFEDCKSVSVGKRNEMKHGNTSNLIWSNAWDLFGRSFQSKAPPATFSSVFPLIPGEYRQLHVKGILSSVYYSQINQLILFLPTAGCTVCFILHVTHLQQRVQAVSYSNTTLHRGAGSH